MNQEPKKRQQVRVVWGSLSLPCLTLCTATGPNMPHSQFEILGTKEFQISEFCGVSNIHRPYWLSIPNLKFEILQNLKLFEHCVGASEF